MSNCSLKKENLREFIHKPIHKGRLQKIHNLFKNQEVVYKEDICNRLNIDERSARTYITALKYIFPVISHSGSKGYKIARRDSDYEELKRTTNEYLSRVNEFLEIVAVNLKKMEKDMNVDWSITKATNKYLEELRKTRKEQFKI